MPRQYLIFVYGTLKRGFCRAHFLAGQSFLGEALTLPRYRMYNCGTYPGLQLAEDGLEILGEVWSVDEACLVLLDQVEEVDTGLYSRAVIQLARPLPEPVRNTPVEAYFYRPSVAGFPDCGEQWID